jgi:hypothetical protein
MKVEEVSNLFETRPFRPLRFHLSGGSAVDVEHPGTAVITRLALHIYTRGDNPRIMEGDWISVAPCQIVKAEFRKAPPEHKGNGKMKK